jgi:anti-sigma factor RsiW
MQCIDIRNKLNALADGELPAPEAARITRHLTQCPACRQEADWIRQMATALDALPAVQAPAALSRRTLHLFRARVEKPRLAEWWQGLNLVMRGAVCGTALAGLLCGAVLGTSLSKLESPGSANPYQTLYASKGIWP